jgi:RND family efflux transporter MFP subunit
VITSLEIDWSSTVSVRFCKPDKHLGGRSGARPTAKHPHAEFGIPAFYYCNSCVKIARFSDLHAKLFGTLPWNSRQRLSFVHLHIGVRPYMGSPDLSALRIDDHHRSSSGNRKTVWIVAAVLILLVAVGALVAFRPRTDPVEVMTVHAATKDTPATLLNASGYVTPRRRSTIAAKITARVTNVYTDEGMRVKAGQVLATLDDSDARVRLNSAKADLDAAKAQLADLEVNLANAETELRRSEQLVKGGISTQQSLDLARTAVNSYKARIASTRGQITASERRVDVSQQDVDNCIVRSPYSGLIVSKDAQVGEMVSPISAGGGFTRTGIATIVDMESLEIEVDVNESYIARVKDGQPVNAILDAYPDWNIPSKVRTIIPTADRQKATVKVRITFDQLDPKILPDMGVKVSFLQEQTKEAKKSNQTYIPKQSILVDSGSPVVFLYREGKAERRAIKVGGTRGDDQEVIAGLTEGDQLIVRAGEKLHDGQTVELKK